ncbi:ribonuclease HI [Ahniella affigens]|uniref:Ribonuclease H n=1 Tax=Ahniella affigens TaxID=2021234 RepID=A0A2P1PNB7_9GAMM|nr:ribonuclease HI [Ahniella affigens]AVP96328.1 ribonuclease HI [Ahniella affigens]
MTETVWLFTDGACSGNPGPGGWGALLRYKKQERELSGAEPDTTNNRMEMMAVIMGLRALTRPCRVQVVSDSQYVIKGIQEWLPAWRRNGFKTAAKKPVANEDLWRALDAEVAKHQVQWQWVRGHDGHAENERVDTLARAAIDQLREAS